MNEQVATVPPGKFVGHSAGMAATTTSSTPSRSDESSLPVPAWGLVLIGALVILALAGVLGLRKKRA